MEVKQLGFMGMLSYFQVVIPGITDPRSASNATRYSLKDAILGNIRGIRRLFSPE